MVEYKVLSTEDMSRIPRPKWLIEEFVAENSTTMIYGPWGLGKSFMTLDMVLTATTGADWYGRKIERPLKTLFVVAEGAAWWYRRVLAYERLRGPVNRDNIVWIPEPVDLWEKDGKRGPSFDALEEILQMHEPDILVIDTWVRCSSAYGMNEDKATDTSMVYNKLDYLRDKYNVAPILVHHPTKSGGARGSGNQEASVERVIALQAVPGHDDLFDVMDEKGNHIEPFKPFRMRFETVHMDDLLEGLSSAVVVHEGLVPEEDKSRKLNRDRNSTKLYNAAKPLLPMTMAQMKNMGVIPGGSVSGAVRELVDEGLLTKNDEGEYDAV